MKSGKNVLKRCDRYVHKSGCYITYFLLLFIPAILISCSFSIHETDTLRNVTATSNTLPYPIDNVDLTIPTVGLFIGISNYREEAGVYSTPAHTISAATMMEPFYRASRPFEKRKLNETILERKSSIILQPHEDTVNYVIFSPDARYVLTASDDCTAKITPLYPKVNYRFKSSYGSTTELIKLYDDRPSAIFSHSNPVVSATYSANGSRIVTVSNNGKVLILDSEGKEKPIALEHPQKVVTAELNPTGTHVLTTSSDDGFVRILSIDTQMAPFIIPAEEGCLRASLANFSPDGKYVTVIRCSDISVWQVFGEIKSRVLLLRDEEVYSLQYIRNGSHVAVLSSIGMHQLPLDGKEKPIFLKKNWGEDIERIIVSPDGKYIAALYENGMARIWDVNNLEKPVFQSGQYEILKGIQFSPDSNRVLTISLHQKVRLLYLNERKAFLEIIDFDNVKVREIRNKIAQWENSYHRYHWYEELLKIRPYITMLKFDKTGQRVLLRYSNGAVVIHAVEGSENYDDEPRSEFLLLADLRMDPCDPLTLGVVHHLANLSGTYYLLNRYETKRHRQSLNKDHSWNYLGEGQLITKDRIFRSLEDIIQRAEKRYSEEDEVRLIIYISAHGWIGKDGNKYIIPADANADDSTSWIAYEELLAPIYEFIANRAPNKFKQAVVIFDACQIQRYNNVTVTENPKNMYPPEVIVVNAASPGQYVWHWTRNQKIEKSVKVIFESRRGFPLPPPKAKRGSKVTEHSRRMSVVPIANQWILGKLVKRKEQSEETDDKYVLPSEWLSGLLSQVDIFLDDIQEKEESGRQQEIQIHHGESTDIPLFNIINNAENDTIKIVF